MKVDFHIHSTYSIDSILSPWLILKISKKMGLNGIAVTDHGTIKGGLKTKKINEDEDFQVIIGSEIRTEFGDVIGLFLNEEIKSHEFRNVIDEIKSQGGYSVLAHPFRFYNHPENLIDKVDIVEIFNSRSNDKINNMAYQLLANINKPIIAVSDSHLPFEIGKGSTYVDSIENFKKNKLTLSSLNINRSHYYLYHAFTKIIKKSKLFINYTKK